MVARTLLIWVRPSFGGAPVSRFLRYRALLLDWDGTVRDSIGSIVGCALDALKSLGFKGDPEVIRATVGLDIDESIRRWAPAADSSKVDLIQQSYRQRWIDHWHASAELFLGAAQCLQDLHRQGYWLAVATGKSRVGLERDFGTLPKGLREVFLATRTADESRSKPDPAMVHSILQELGVDRSEALVVGDSTFDLLMAQNAGCDGVGVLGGACTQSELEACGAVAVLPGIGELQQWLLGSS